MKKKILFVFVLLWCGVITQALAGDNSPVQKQVAVAGLPEAANIAYIDIQTMTSPAVHYRLNNEKLGVSLEGAARASDEKSLDKMLNASFEFRRDGGLVIKAKKNGLYHCSVSTSNGDVTEVSGVCLLTVQIDFAAGHVVPLYVNGRLQQLN